MFDCLRTTDDGGIEHLFVFDLPCDFVSLSDQAVMAGQVVPLGSLPSFRKTPVEPNDLVFRFP